MSDNLATPYQSWPVRFGNRFAPFLLKHKLMPQLGAMSSLLETACRRSGLSDFGRDDFREPLSILLSDLSHDTTLHPMGRFLHREFLLKFLSARLKLQSAYAATPQMQNERIERPIIILGLPRTGTTRLFNILARDERHRALTLWESYRPVPAPQSPGPPRELRRFYARMDRNAAYFLGPDLPSVHHLEVDGPEECIHLLSTTFLSWIFMLEYNAPTYHQHFLQCDHAWAYEEYADILKYLQTGYKKDRWLLKSPTHIFGIEAILKAFPDAVFVHTHRDPMKVVASTASLALVARGMGSIQLDPKHVGDQIFTQMDTGLNRLVAGRNAIPADRILDVQYSETISNPMHVVETIYEKFGIALTETTRAAMDEEIHARPQHFKGKHQYNPADFGYSKERIEAAFADYSEAFQVPTEA